MKTKRCVRNCRYGSYFVNYCCGCYSFMGVVIPMIRDNLQSGQACLNAPNVFEIKTTTGMTCYNATTGRLYVQIGRSTADVDISQINIRPIDAEGNSININLDIESEDLGPNGLSPGNVQIYPRISSGWS